MTLPDVRPPGRIALIIILLGTAWTCWLLAGAWRTNGGPGFPLDDPWIHLQFARNLHDAGSYSFNRADPVTAGSTSPLYTCLLAAGLFVTSDEMILSYVLGLLSFAVAGYFFFQVCRRLFPGSPLVSLAGLALFLLEPRMQWAALSGMETSLFIALLLACISWYSAGRHSLLALGLGLLLWIRPEAIALMVTVCIVAIAGRLRKRAPGENLPPGSAVRSLWIRTRVPVAILGLLVVPYFLMNLLFSGTLLPNSVAAKLGYYYPEQGAFFSDLAEFLGGHHLAIVAPFALAGCYVAVRDAWSRRGTGLLLLLAWSAGMIFTFGLKLPYLYQQGRYMMPLIPAVLILGLAGADMVMTWAQRRWVQGSVRRATLAASGVIVIVLLAQFLDRDAALAREYAGSCAHVRDLQVATALWLRENTPGDAVVATHDIGAIGYYSGRRIVDIAGLVYPAIIPYVRQLDSLPSFLDRNHVTHLVVLRNWYEVVNVNALFRRGRPDDEIMEVFPFDPLRLHIVRPEATNAVGQGLAFLRQGDIARAGVILESAVNLDPLSSRSHLSLGLARQSVGQRKLAEQSFRNAIALQPDLWAAQIALAQMEAEQGRADDGIGRLRAVIAEKPDLDVAYVLLADMYTRWKSDSLAAREVRMDQAQRSQERRGD